MLDVQRAFTKVTEKEMPVDDAAADATRFDEREATKREGAPRERELETKRALAIAKRAIASARCAIRARKDEGKSEQREKGCDAFAFAGAIAGVGVGARMRVANASEFALGEGVNVSDVRSRTSANVVIRALEVGARGNVARASGGTRYACARGEPGARGVDSVPSACLKHLEAIVRALEEDGKEGEEDARARAEAEVNAWALTSAAFAEDARGAKRGTAADVHRRRASVSAWLREQVSRTQQVEASADGRRAASTHAKSGRTVSAARAAAAHGDPRLATCMAQIGAGKNLSFYAKQQLNRWRSGSVGTYVSPESEEAFKLLAGEVARDDDGMGWYQNFGLHLWLAAGPTSSLRDVVKSYCDAVKLRKAANPSPPVASAATLEANKATHLRDVAFNILDIAASAEDGSSPSTAQIRLAFHPLTYSDDVLNASLAWHLFMMLNAIDVIHGDDVDALADEFTVAFVTQLATLPERSICVWIVFVAQHLRDKTRREKLTGHILRERFEDWNGDDAKVAFLLNECAVHQSALDEAKSLWFTYSHPRA